MNLIQLLIRALESGKLTRGLIYKISYDLSYNYLKFVVISSYDNDYNMLRFLSGLSYDTIRYEMLF